MTGRLMFYLSLLLFCYSCTTVEKIQAGKPINCAVLTFESRSGLNAGEAETITELFSTSLQNSGRFVVVERNRIEAVLKEREFQAMQDEENVAKAGKILSIRKMFSGSIGKLGAEYLVSVKMIDVESSRVDFSVTKKYDDDLADINDEFIPGLVRDIVRKTEEMNIE
jgi:TolB-like protein